MSSHRHWHAERGRVRLRARRRACARDRRGRGLLRPGMAAGFPAGEANGHHLVNRGAAPATYLEIGTRSKDEEATYSDIDMRLEKRDGDVPLLHQGRRALLMRVADELLKAPIHLYRWTLKAFVGWNCRHTPTCSQYALEAIDRNGAWRGLWLTLSRLVALPSLGHARPRPGARHPRRASHAGALALRPLAARPDLTSCARRSM